jgi:protein-S-isoprenylcysteine O-methyltransferase Ste14
MLLLRAIVAFLALPALVGFAIPIWLGTSTGRGVQYLLAALFTLGFHLRVLLYEEPWAARRFGSEWDAYRARVPRWVI